jgi:hypothetical protein
MSTTPHTRPSHRLIVAALAAAAALAPATAQAKPADMTVRESKSIERSDLRYVPQDRASALAQERYFGSYGTLHSSGHQDLRSADARHAALLAEKPVQSVPQDLRSPDARDAAHPRSVPVVADLPQDLRSPDARDAARPRPIPVAAPDLPARVADDGFDWPSAGIGAGIVLVLALGAGAGVAFLGRRRSALAS